MLSRAKNVTVINYLSLCLISLVKFSSILLYFSLMIDNKADTKHEIKKKTSFEKQTRNCSGTLKPTAIVGEKRSSLLCNTALIILM